MTFAATGVARPLAAGPMKGMVSPFLQSTPSVEGPLWSRGASELAALIARKEVSCREVLQSHLDRIAAVNGRVNAITQVLGERALQAAQAADRAVSEGRRLGVLHGVPMTVKENIDLEGSATTQGTPALKQAVAPMDSPHIAQLRRAGAIPIARTNLPDFGLRWHTDSSLHGATLNPWDPARTPGGSSGGDAAALATGMTPLGNGNDYGGSLRFPAQCCGIASIRPSRGRVPHASSTSPGDPPLTIQLFAVEGPMARRVADVRLALAAMSGSDPRDPWWTAAPLDGEPLARPLKVAVATRLGASGIDPDVVDGVKKAARALEAAGYAIEEMEPPAVDEASMLWMTLVAAEIRAVMWPQMSSMVSEDGRAFMSQVLAPIPEIDLAGYMKAFSARNAMARLWTQFLDRYPLILGPVATEQPFRVGQDLAGEEAAAQILKSMRLVVVANLLGLPAAAVPVGLAGGIPQGVQIIGRPYREDLCLDAAQAIENELGTLTPRDPSAPGEGA
jgi:amidase